MTHSVLIRKIYTMVRLPTALATAFSVLSCSSALATPWSEDAEARRLVQEMNDLAERNAWVGVSRAYERVLALPDVDLDTATHWLAAEASRNQGDMVMAWVRLNQVLSVEPLHSNAIYQRAVIEASYGEVTLRTPGGPDPTPVLMGEDLGFNPEYRFAFEHAQEALDEFGRYEGLLPLGRYQLGEVEFEVLGGDPLMVKVRPNGKGRTRVLPTTP